MLLIFILKTKYNFYQIKKKVLQDFTISYLLHALILVLYALIKLAFKNENC